MSVSQLQAWAESEANELIKKYDRNGDGVLTQEELQSFLHDARGSTQVNNTRFVSSRTIPKTNDKVQNPSTKVLDRKQFKAPLSREQMKEIFKYHDTNKDGFLSILELTKAFGCLGINFSFYKARYGMAYADADQDGLISEAELDKLVDYANKIIRNK